MGPRCGCGGLASRRCAAAAVIMWAPGYAPLAGSGGCCGRGRPYPPAEPRDGFAQPGGQIDCRVVAGGQRGGFVSRGGYVVSSGRNGTDRDDRVRRQHTGSHRWCRRVRCGCRSDRCFGIGCRQQQRPTARSVVRCRCGAYHLRFVADSSVHVVFGCVGVRGCGGAHRGAGIAQTQRDATPGPGPAAVNRCGAHVGVVVAAQII